MTIDNAISYYVQQTAAISSYTFCCCLWIHISK